MDRTLLRRAAMLHTKEILPPYNAMLDLDGFDAIYTFAEHVGGSTIYVPNIRSIFARCLEREAEQEFTGFNFADLAKKYGFSERHIRRAIKQL